MPRVFWEVVFWVSAAALAQAAAGYPLLMALRARLAPRPVRRGPAGPAISVLIAARNEADALPRKLRRLLEADGSELIQEILVASDASTDGTDAAVRAIADPRVSLIRLEPQRGKAACLNDLVARSRGEALLFTDARETPGAGALPALAAALADPEVGVVSGLYAPRADGGVGATAYWPAEARLRRWESASGSVPGASGAGYLVRRELVHPIPPDTILDDVAIPMQAIQAGRRCILEPAAVFHDDAASSLREEFARRRRTQAGVIQLAWRHIGWALPGSGRIWFRWVSHRVLRAKLPFFALGLLAAGWALWGLVVLAAAAALDLAGLALLAARGGPRRAVPPGSFALLVTLAAWWDFAAGKHRRGWK